MKEIAATRAKTSLGQVLDWVEGGEEVVITRRGKAVARLVPTQGRTDPAQAQAAAEAIMAMRRGVTLGGLRIKDLIEEGRM